MNSRGTGNQEHAKRAAADRGAADRAAADHQRHGLRSHGQQTDGRQSDGREPQTQALRDEPRRDEPLRDQPIRGEWRLLAPALVSWACAAVTIHRPGAAAIAAVAAALVGCGTVVAWLVAVRRRSRGIGARLAWGGAAVVCCTMLLLVGGRIDVLERGREHPLLVDAAASQRDTALTVTLAGYPAGLDGFGGTERSWVRARVTAVAETDISVPVPVVLWVPEPPHASWFPGRVVQVSGRITRGPPEGSSAYEVRVSGPLQGLAAGSTAGACGEIATRGPASGEPARDGLGSGGLAGGWLAVGTAAAELRQGLRDAALDVPGAAMLPGLAVGDTSLIDDELESLMLAASLTHLTAVSGSNCALVVTAVTAVSARLGAGRRLRIVISAVGLAGFVLVVGPDPSVQRAGVMAAVMLVSGFGGKRGRALPALGLAAFALLLADPWQAVQPGFALSVVAAGGILLWATSLEHWLRGRARLPRVLALPLAVATVAQAACAPLLLLLQPGLPLGGVLANLLAAPAAPAGTAIGMLALLLLPLHGELGSLLVAAGAWPARWIESAGRLAVSMPASTLHWPGGWGGVVLLAGVYLLLGTSWAFATGWLGSGTGVRLTWASPSVPPRRTGSGAGQRRPVVRRRWSEMRGRSAEARRRCAEREQRLRGSVRGSRANWAVRQWLISQVSRRAARWVAKRSQLRTPLLGRVFSASGIAALAGGVAAGVAVATILIVPFGLRHSAPNDWIVAACDVGQGDAILLRDPEHPREVMLVDTGEEPELLRACLRQFGVKRVALLVLTHNHQDHVGAVDVVLPMTGTVLVPPGSDEDGDAPPISEAIAASGARTVEGHAGVRSPESAAFHWEVLAPPARARHVTANASSLVLHVQIQGIDVLLLGDTGESEQRALLRSAPELSADIVKVAHHGSRDQAPELYDRLGAAVALVTVGGDNHYGHPNAELLERIEEGGARPYRSDLHGSIAVRVAADGLHVWTSGSREAW